MASSLHKIFHKQHSKVKYSHRKSALLVVFANGDHKAIATVISTWLSDDKNK